MSMGRRLGTQHFCSDALLPLAQGLKRVNSSGLDGLAAAAGNGGGNGRAAKRAKIGHAAGGSSINIAGVDMGAFDQLVNTPAARSLGARSELQDF